MGISSVEIIPKFGSNQVAVDKRDGYESKREKA